MQKLTRTEFETLAVLRRHPLSTTRELAALLGLNPERDATRNRLQKLRRKGVAKTNGKRGPFSRWVAVSKNEVEVEVGGDLPFRVHRELNALGAYRSPHEIAALLGEDLDEVRGAIRFLVRVGAVTQMGTHVMVERPAAFRREDIERIVLDWHARRSPAEQEVTAPHSLDALVELLSAKLA